MTAALTGLEAAPVSRWLAETLPGFTEPAEFTLVAGGRSNLTYRISDAAGHVYALRRPPVGSVLSTAHDMGREWRFVSAMVGTGVPVATPRAHCTDLEVTGAEFTVMDFVDGRVLASVDDALELSPRARARAGEHMVEVLAALHSLDPDERGIPGSRRGFVERQLARWHDQVRATGVEGAELALFDDVHAVLAKHVPTESRGIVHGDYRPGNLSFAPDGTVVAVFDWELSTTGDPMADLGYLVSHWHEPGDELREGVEPGPTTVPGFPDRAAVARHYAALTGRDVSDLGYWVAFHRWRSAAILAGVRARYLAGAMADDGFLAQVREDPAAGRLMAEPARQALEDAGLR
ncbi:phosphotransferase family protein [Pseudonocardia pini]|uniref:phosphotransferase family protein n=1 Tax=Pseudonocardia pini TaxID=2758030 RepID=UPI0015F008AA|nr:phosphotransferase family protein [Pseudonocardia pini]